MARTSLYRDTVVANDYGRAVLLGGARVWFFLPDGQQPPTPYAQPLYPSKDATAPLVQPYVTGPDGEIEVWADAPVRLLMTVEAPGRHPANETIDIEAPPDQGATDQDIANAVTDHEGKPDPHPVYLTEPEGNLLYLPLAHAPGTDPHPQYLTQAEGDGRYPLVGAPDPYPQYQTLSQKGQPNGYAPLEAGGLIPTMHLPPLAITDTFVVANQAERLALTAQTGDVCIQTDTGKSYILAAEPPSVDANWKELSAAAPVTSVDGRVGVVSLSDLYVNTSGDTMTGQLTMQADINMAASRWISWPLVSLYEESSRLKLDGDVTISGDLIADGQAVAASPDAANILEWRGNGFYTNGLTSTVNVLQEEEFTPAAAATTVTLSLTPAHVYTVTRNGVVQSDVAGHYSVAGSVLSFSDAFAAGERVSVLYDTGTSVPVDTYSKAESDSRYVNVVGDTMTGTLGLVAPDVDTPALSARLTGDTEPRFWVTGEGSLFWGKEGDYYIIGADWDGHRLWANAPFTPAIDISYELGLESFRWGKVWAYDADLTTALTFANDATAKLSRTGPGALRVDTNLGVGGNPAAWATTHRAVQIGLASAVNADVVNATDIELSQNTIIGQAARTAAYTGPAAMLRLAHPASLTFSTAASVAAGAAQTFTTRASIAQNGTLTLTADEGASGLVVNGSVVTTSTNNTAGYQFASRDTAAQGFLWYAQAGNAYLYDLVKPANRLQISPTGTLTLTPDAGQFTLTGGNPADHLRITAAANHVLFSAPGGVVGPATDNTLASGTAGLRWTAVYAVTGTIQTSSLEMKENVRPLDPVAALAAVKGAEVILFNYKAPPPPDPLPDGYQAPPQFEHAGYDAAAVDPLLVMDDQSVNPQNTASVALAAIQALLSRIEALEKHVGVQN